MKIFFLFIFTLSLLSPLGNRRHPSFEETWIPFIQGCFCAQWFLRRFLKIWSMFFRYFVIIIPWKRVLYLYKCQHHWTEDALCQVWLKLTQLIWRRRWKCKMFTNRRTDRRTDDGQQAIRKVHLSFQLITLISSIINFKIQTFKLALNSKVSDKMSLYRVVNEWWNTQ